MELPKLSIVQQQRADIGFTTRNAALHISQPKADVRYNSPQPDVTYTQTQGKLHIDQSQAFNEANLKSPLTMTFEAAQKAKQAVLKGISRRVREGEQLMDIAKNKQLMIPHIMKQRSAPEKTGFNIGFMPSSVDAVKIHYQPGHLSVNVNLENFVLEASPNMPKFQYQRGDFNIYLKQKNDLQFQAYTPGLDARM